jgi:putative long chain acyl-CoA synthase
LKPDRMTRLMQATRNALTLLRRGRIGPAYHRPFEVTFEDHRVTLRRYRAPSPDPRRRPILLVPPLMVTSEIYDISPELSAVAFLTNAGIDTWIADFGPPEAHEHGLARTLDDHVLAVSDGIDRIRALTGLEVHLVGYSQGGLFCYQTAAWRAALNLPGLASITTFGAPVDLRRNLPLPVHDSLVERALALSRRALDRPLRHLDSLPGALTSLGFKLLAPRQELRLLVQTLGLLHDADALMALEPKRRFLGGEGFIAWPGPALRTFLDDVVVQNRLARGGFVIAGRTASLADIKIPICCFWGTTDDLAQPASVLAIEKATSEEVHTVAIPAGHFGLVVGRAAMSHSWPTVVSWTASQDGLGPFEPPQFEPPSERHLPDLLAASGEFLWDRLGKLSVNAIHSFDRARWKLSPRGRKLSASGEASLPEALRREARRHPTASCFVWRGRAYTWEESYRRVEAFARMLGTLGLRFGMTVAIDASMTPDTLAAIAAAHYLGATVVLDPDLPSDLTLPISSDTLEPLLLASADLTLEPIAAPRAPAFAPNLSHEAWMTRAIALANRARLGRWDTILCPASFPPMPVLTTVAAAAVAGSRLVLADDPPARFWAAIRHVGASVALVDPPLLEALLAEPDSAQDKRHPLRYIASVSGLPTDLVDLFRARFGEALRFGELSKIEILDSRDMSDSYR